MGLSHENIFHELAFGFEVVSAADRYKRVLVSVPVAMVLTKRKEVGNVLRAVTAAMADWVVCAGCRRGRG